MLRVLAIATLLAGCHFASETADLSGGDDSGAVPECETAVDCVLAASTCCGCPEFAMPDRGWQDGCEDVACPDPDPSSCSAVSAACVDGLCTTACVVIACELSCPNGFATDAAGCLTCGCAGGAPAASCAVDDDCVAVPADCCGCARGGADTAVPAQEADTFGEALDCSGNAGCPEVDVCDASAVPRCVAGQCQLGDGVPITDLVGPCGRPDLPACPDGTICVLNASADASMQGLGTCQSI